LVLAKLRHIAKGAPMSSTLRILFALLAGLVLGAVLAALGPSWRGAVVSVIGALGGVWLDALRMTIVPLVFALLVTGVAQAAGALQAGGVAARAMIAFCLLLLASASLAAVATPLVLQLWPTPTAAAAALRAAAHGAGDMPPAPPLAAWLSSFVPDNPVKAAADGAMAPLVFFALMFGLAAASIDAARRERLFGFFDAAQAAMMVIVEWVLWVAPAGVFALALVFGARTGVAGLGVLAHYVGVVSLMCLGAGVIGLLVGMIGGRLAPGRLLNALIPVSAVAISTQSSLACLPTMLEASKRLGVSDSVRDLVLPMAVALFRITSPAGNMAVAIYVAHMLGVAVDPARVVAGIVVAVLVSLAAVGIASSVTFFTTLGPIFMAMGLPMDLLPLLLAVETLPDLSRTLGNIAGQVGVTAMLDRSTARPSG
jgi:Na+/H+-dicarboxylate symporter